MNTPRFFYQEPLTAEATVTLPASVSHHIRVRRLKAGQEITLFDGSGTEFKAILQFEPSGQAIALVGVATPIDRELSHRLTLVQGIASQDRMDWVVEKAVELGAAELIPVSANRSVVKLSGERALKRTTHWQKLVISASEQSGRNRLMQIQSPHSIAQVIDRLHTEPMLLCHFVPNAISLNDPELLEKIRTKKAACIIIGPEGGWDDVETNRWLAAGAKPVSLGPRVLRTETAGAAAIAALAQLLDR